MNSEPDLWIELDDLNDPVQPAARSHARSVDTAHHIGCPLSWFKAVFSVVRGKNELAIALYIYRLRVVHRSQTVTVSNASLLAELGIDRYAKYRALRRLANAGIIAVRCRGKLALEISFLDDGR